MTLAERLDPDFRRGDKESCRADAIRHASYRATAIVKAAHQLTRA
jgi:hypothetical protein